MPATQTSPQRLEYDVVDVFTDRPFAGNPLAVVYGAEGLDASQLQRIACEFNLSETTFPMATSADDPAGADYRVRIFTPAEEIPFAGHPTLGTAWALAQRGVIEPGDRGQLCGAGLIGVAVPADPDAAVELTAVPRDHATPLPDDAIEELCELVSLTPDDAIGPAYTAGTGLTWVYLRVRPDAVPRSRTRGRPLREAAIDFSHLADPVDGIDVFSVGPDAADGTVVVESRVYVPGFGIPEDPATGSAAAGLGPVLVATGLAAADGESRYAISQGVAMGRPSVLAGRVEAVAGRAERVHVAGQVVAVSTGTIRVP